MLECWDSSEEQPAKGVKPFRRSKSFSSLRNDSAYWIHTQAVTLGSQERTGHLAVGLSRGQI
jgi:hypothetical protein